MKQQKKHIIHLSISEDVQCQFTLHLAHIQKHVSFLLDLLCSLPSEVSIRFCQTEEMIEANFQFRKIKKPTDVLSFESDLSFAQNKNYLGDVLICVPVCVAQAKRARHSLSQETIKMLTHSLVHLKGFDHERSDSAARIMSKLERALLLELHKTFGRQILIRTS